MRQAKSRCREIEKRKGFSPFLIGIFLFSFPFTQEIKKKKTLFLFRVFVSEKMEMSRVFRPSGNRQGFHPLLLFVFISVICSQFASLVESKEVTLLGESSLLGKATFSSCLGRKVEGYQSEAGLGVFKVGHFCFCY